MIVFCYDKTWDGLLSALFDAFSLQLFPERLMACDDIPPSWPARSTRLSQPWTSPSGSAPGLRKNFPRPALL